MFSVFCVWTVSWIFLVHQSGMFFVLLYFDCCIDCIVFLVCLSVCLSLHTVVWIKIIKVIGSATARKLSCFVHVLWQKNAVSRKGCNSLNKSSREKWKPCLFWSNSSVHRSRQWQNTDTTNKDRVSDYTTTYVFTENIHLQHNNRAAPVQKRRHPR